MPLWFKRCGSVLPANTANESDILAFNGKLVLAVFNRPPLTQQVIFYDISDPTNLVQLAVRPWAGAMGSMLVDSAGVLHIYGSSPPAQNTSPYNSIIHSSVDANWNLSTPNTIIGPSGMGFNNIGVAAAPGGYVLAVEQAYSNGNKAESYLFSTAPDFSASPTWKSAFYNPGSPPTPTTDFTGRSRIRSMSDGWTYITSDSSQGYCRIARTQDFVNFKFATNSTFGFLGPGPQDAFPGTVGGNPFYDGNVSWEQWTFQGAPCVYSIYFESNETNNGELMLGVYLGTLSDLFSRFSFAP
ncbi:hypothetical protein NK6_5660 [Bradyrhizobium diazoefficiens]|uniref:Uncharacterized protein n=1 Tax=Bradyrhizobium diazoefficiens TaxID=1355477 RepID=A0A0E4FX02_9BRAD|nr:hypothetical protein NK6_5660 [Bradyrhizobium diazoefficiens]